MSSTQIQDMTGFRYFLNKFLEIENNKYEDEAFVRDFPQKLKMEDEK